MNRCKKNKTIRFCLLLLCVSSMTGCYTLQVPTVSNPGNLRDYQYAYIIPASGVSASYEVSGNQYGVYGGKMITTNPSEVIAGYLMKKGYTILPELTADLEEKTLVINYGHLGKRRLSLFSHSNIVILQFRNAQTHELVASSEAEGGNGANEANDILQAITRALDALFK